MYLEYAVIFLSTTGISILLPFMVHAFRALWFRALDAFPTISTLKQQNRQYRQELQLHLLATAELENERLALKRKLAFIHGVFLDGSLMPPHRVEVQRVLLRMASSLNCPHGSPDHRVDYCPECVDLQYGKRNPGARV